VTVFSRLHPRPAFSSLDALPSPLTRETQAPRPQQLHLDTRVRRAADLYEAEATSVPAADVCHESR